MFKKLIFFWLALCLLFCFVSCEESEPPKSQTTHTHQYVDATCTTPKTCTICDEIAGSSLGHDYQSATCTAPKTCTRCAHTVGLALDHNYAEATCTAPQACTRCDEIKGTALGHDYTDATCVLQETCTRCGNKKGDKLGHNYVNNICSRCSQPDPESLPVELGALQRISMSSTYESGWYNGVMSDALGNVYNGYFRYSNVDIGSGITSVHALEGKYNTFSGGIVSCDDTSEGSYMKVYIYVDNVLVYTSPTFDRTTEKIDFSIDVSGGEQLKIECVATETVYGWSSHLALVETQLIK